MAEDSITNVINGELRKGDVVVSYNANEYSYLAGIVRSITKHGTPEHDTGSPGDDIHVNFFALEYSPRRVSEIEGEFRKVYGDWRDIDDLPLDDVIMSPDMLIRANNIDLTSRDEMYEILDSDEGAMEYCQRVLSAHGLSLDGPVVEAVANKSFTIEKLYSPLEFYLHNPREEEANGEYGEYDLHDERYKISHLEVVDQYADAIELAVRRDRDTLDRVRGMAEYLPDELQGKVHSIFPNTEQRGFDMYCAATIELTTPLTADETAALKDWWRGQLSDGWGEGFEQREIKVGYSGNELYMVPWTSNDSVFFLETGAEFAQRMSVSPEYLGVTVLAVTVEKSVADVLSHPSPALSVAQKSLDEPDAHDSQDVAALREQLLARIDGNMSDYFDTLRPLDGKEIIGRSSEIAMMTEAHFYLSEIYGFHLSDTQYLLQFKNPLEVVANAFEAEGFDNQRSEAMWKIFDREDALQGDYELVSVSAEPSAVEAPKGYVIAVTEDSNSYISGALHIERDDGLHVYTNDEEATKAAERDGVKLIYGMPFVPDGVYIDTPENREAIAHSFEQHRLSLPAGADLVSALHDRLDENFAAYKAEALRLGKEGLFYDAPEITAVLHSHEYFRNEHALTTGQVEFLLKLQNPLELVSDRWGDGIGGTMDVVKAIFSDQERTLNSSSYELASDDSETPPTTISTQEKSRSVAGVGEKSSVIDEIRQSQKDARENPPAPRDKSFDRAARKNSEPDL